MTPVPPAALGAHDSENPLLETSSLAAFAAAGQPLANTPMHVSGGGEQVYAWQEGVPEIAVNGGSLWFHTAADVPSVVDPGILTRFAAGYRGSVDAILAQPAGAVRAANSAAASFAAASPASPTAAPRSTRCSAPKASAARRRRWPAPARGSPGAARLVAAAGAGGPSLTTRRFVQGLRTPRERVGSPSSGG